MVIGQEQAEKIDQPTSQIITIDRVFIDGSSTVTYLGRNDSIVRAGLMVPTIPIRKILLLGGGCYEPWTTAGQQVTRTQNSEVVSVDRDQNITGINETIKNTGVATIDDIMAIVGNPVFGNEKQRE